MKTAAIYMPVLALFLISGVWPPALNAHQLAEQSKNVAEAEARAKARDFKLVKHSGGTDSKGCHKNSKTGDYHCHKPK